MRLSTSTTIAFNRPNGVKADIVTAVESCADAGYRVLDMNFHDCCMHATPLQTDDWERWVDSIGETAASRGVEFGQAHLHFYEFIGADADMRAHKEELVRRCLIGASRLGVKWAVTHAATDFGAAQWEKSSFHHNRAYFSNMLEKADKLGVGIAIENLWDLNIAPLKRYTSTAEQLVELVDSLPQGNVGVCWDCEHADIMHQPQAPALELIGKRLVATHISDHYGIEADHQLPFMGRTNWDKFMSALAAIDYNGDFAYETHRYTQNIPDQLLPAALRFSIEVGEYLISLAEKSTTI